MTLDPDAPDFARRLRARCSAGGSVEAGQGRSRTRRRSARRAASQRADRDGPCSAPDDFLPEKNWRVLASTGYICDDPYTGTAGVTQRRTTGSTR